MTTLIVTAAIAGPSVLAGATAGGATQADDGTTWARLDSGATFWQGQTLWLSGGEANATRTWQLREWEEADGGTVGALVTELQLNESGVFTLRTADRQGQYVIVDEQGNPVFFGNGTVAEDPTATDPSFEVAVQTLNASFADETVTAGGGDRSLTDLELRTNRGEFRVVLRSDELSPAQLADVFGANRTDVDGDGQQEVVLGRPVTGPRDAIDADFGDVSPGEYEVVVGAVDAAASARAAIQVREAGQQDAALKRSVVVEHRGDVATFTVDMANTRNATVTVGSQEVNYVASVGVRDADGDGQVTLRYNTFLAGRGANATGGFAAVGADEVTDYELETPPLGSPLEAGQYPITVALDETTVDLATLRLVEPSVGSATVWTAPDAARPGTAAELLEVVSRDDTVAREDWAVVEVEASGVFGYLDEPADLTNRSLGLQTTVVRTNPGPNQQAEPLSTDRIGLLTDPENDTVYLAVDTNGLEAGAEYRANFTLTEDNPYVGGNRSASANFSIVERSVTLGEQAGEEPINVSLDEGVVRGTSTLAPGSQFDVRLRNTGGNAFLRTAQATVEGDGTWSAAFDLPEVLSGTEALVLVPDYNLSRQTVLVEGPAAPGAAAGQATETTTTTETTETTTTTTTTETTTTTTETTTTTTTTETTTPEEGGDGAIPGFGAGVALVALVAAALLALRRSR